MTYYSSHARCANGWARQESVDGKTHKHRVFYVGRTIYSYRRDWPLATIKLRGDGTTVRSIVLLNDERYSQSTAHHLSHVRTALRDFLPGVAVCAVSCDTLLRSLSDDIDPMLIWRELCQRYIDARGRWQRATVNKHWQVEILRQLRASALQFADFSNIAYTLDGVEDAMAPFVMDRLNEPA